MIGRAMRVERRDGETVEQLIRRFNKGVVSERITKTYREKMHFVSKSEQRKEKRRRAERNRRKKALKIF
jgi:small subunit ribosomal protein S21